MFFFGFHLTTTLHTRAFSIKGVWKLGVIVSVCQILHVHVLCCRFKFGFMFRGMGIRKYLILSSCRRREETEVVE